jgi:signal transduction histidine kinase
VSRFVDYFRASLRRKIFFGFGAAIVITGLVVSGGLTLLGGGTPTWRTETERVRTFVSHSFAGTWSDPSHRDALARDLAKDLDLDLVVTDATGKVILQQGPETCRQASMTAPVMRDGVLLGSVQICSDRHRGGHLARRLGIGMLASLVVLWAFAGRIARRMSGPIAEIGRVAREIGAGNLQARARLRGYHGEEARLALMINDMADRIEKQLADQRELLAAVSHEIRTPLARIRILVELARDAPEGRLDEKTLNDLEREVIEIDALVSELLASSRLDFAALSMREVEPIEIASRALERAGLPVDLLSAEGDPARTIVGDVTLLGRALANLLENARRHAGGVTGLRVVGRGAKVAFEVEDDGPGFAAGEETRVFESFYSHGGDRTGLGLGLALVRRIAESHGGRAYAENRGDKGALESRGGRVGIELPIVGVRARAA